MMMRMNDETRHQDYALPKDRSSYANLERPSYRQRQEFGMRSFKASSLAFLVVLLFVQPMSVQAANINIEGNQKVSSSSNRQRFLPQKLLQKEQHRPLSLGKLSTSTSRIARIRGGDSTADEAEGVDQTETESAQENEEVDHQTKGSLVDVSIQQADVSNLKEAITDDDSDDVDKDDIKDSPTSTLSIQAIREKATILRSQGKELHDDGEFAHAATIFQCASQTLEPILLDNDAIVNDDPPQISQQDRDELVQEFTTCLLHEALCQLKNEHYPECISACTKVLQDAESEEQQEDLLGLGLDQSDSDDASVSSITSQPPQPSLIVAPPVRARAHHRRAKAKLAMGDEKGALLDARSAAFLGDSKGVALYGKLMRDSSSNDFFSNNNGFPVSLESMFGGPSGPGKSDPSASLFESLLNKSSPAASSSSPSSSLASLLTGDLNPASLLMGSLTGGKSGDKKDGGLAKSVMQSMSKRLEEDSTQQMICQFLQKTSEEQLGQWAGMAGMELGDGQISTLVRMCHGITPKTIKWTLRTTKGAVYGVKLLRKIGRILRKYRTVIFAIVLLQWCKSSILRPIPINRRAVKQAAKQAAKLALKDAMKATRP